VSRQAAPAGLEERLAAEGLSASRWGNGPGYIYAEHRHDYDKVLVAVDGSIVFQLREVRRNVTLAVGDRLDLPAGTLHGATVGPQGVTCLEAHLPQGSLSGGLRHAGAGW
jgi:mannose-6-phosphate isomerase-like protein (cupin superfamily)